MATKIDPEFDKFLERIRLDNYRESILKLNVSTVEDLQDINEQELNEMGMNPIESRRFTRQVMKELELATPSTSCSTLLDSPIAFIPIDSKTANNVISQQGKRSRLQISYRLITELKPQVRELGIVDSKENYYYDLVNRICEQEYRILGKNLTIELYTCEGYPLATNPSCYISKLSDWCLETYDSILLYAIPRPKIFMETDKNYFQDVNDKTNGDDVIYINVICKCYYKCYL